MAEETGKFLVVEGLEGAGKSTAISTVLDLLAQYNITTMTTREPGGTPIGEMLRSILKNPDYKNVLDDKTELLLMYSARIQLVEEVIKPALARGIWVLADRFELSSFAYQGGGRGLDQNFLQQLSAFSLHGFKPDLTLFLDISPESGMKRAGARGQFDRIEQQSMDFFHKVHAAYMQKIRSDRQVAVIDASQTLEKVQASIQKTLRNYIEQQT
ncbi:MAG: dTMP kinase [Legionella sp.]|jgi:dTMP kinase